MNGTRSPGPTISPASAWVPLAAAWSASPITASSPSVRGRADEEQREQHLALPGAVGQAPERDAAREGHDPDPGERDAGLRGREPDRAREEDRRDRAVEARPGPVD